MNYYAENPKITLRVSIGDAHIMKRRRNKSKYQFLCFPFF